MNSIQTYRKGVSGNMEGDGTLLGSTLVIGTSISCHNNWPRLFNIIYLGPGDKGILYQYLSKEFGDSAKPGDVLSAVKLMDEERK